MSRPILVFGHRNPDADAVCAAIAYAELKGRTGPGDFRPVRCGNSNARIDAILEHFDVPLPEFVGDVTPRLRDVMARDLVTVGPDATCAEVLELIERHDIQVVPVVDGTSRLLGFVSIFQLGTYFVPRLGRAGDEMRRVDSSLESIVAALSADVLHLVDGARVQDLYVRVGAMDIESFERFAGGEEADPERSIIVVGDRKNIQERAIEQGTRLLVISGGLAVEREVLERARGKGVSLIVSPYDSATTAWTIRAATRAGAVMSTEVVEFGPEETVLDVRRKTSTLDPAVFMVTGEDGKLLGVFTRRDLLRPSRTRIILVDHNELSQAVPGADQVEIVEVVDHHRLGDLRTQDPILFINRPVGSTCTIIAEMYRQQGIMPTREGAGIMMGGLISDTLNLRSPTSTKSDREILDWLAELAGVSPDRLSEVIFSSGSVVGTHGVAEVIRMDRKVYEEGEFRFAVSQVEEVGFVEFWDRYDELAAELHRSRSEDRLSFAGLLVTDINSQDSLLLVSGDGNLIDGINYPSVYPGEIFSLPGVVSRKKQLIPFLTALLRRGQA